VPNNVLVTGKPGIGKTTAVHEVVRRLRDEGVAVSGVYSPEIHDDGKRPGFRIEPVEEGGEDGEVMAHIDYGTPKVGKYGVNPSAVDTVARHSLCADEADTVVVDEIAPMQTHSEVFVKRIREVLKDATPVVGVVQEAGEGGFVGEVKERSDTELVRVTGRNGTATRFPTLS